MTTRMPAPARLSRAQAPSAPRAGPAPGPASLAALVTGSPAVRRVTALQAVASRAVLQRADGIEHFRGDLVRETVSSQANLDAIVEDVVDERYGGIEALFQRGETVTSPGQWRDMLWDYLSDGYTLEGLDRSNVLTAVQNVKAKHRKDLLKQIAFNAVFMQNANPYALGLNTPEALRAELTDKGYYVDDAADMEVIEALFETKGKFTALDVETPADHERLLERDKVVVIMDPHQNKHQNPQLAEFPAYSGGSGSQFASDKGLAWHKANTAVVVANMTDEAVAAGNVPDTGTTFASPKRPIDGIIYDLGISYDADSGKYVAVYHCNPVVSEQ